MGCGDEKLSKYLTQTFTAHCNAMICQQVTLLGDAEWPKVADAVIEAGCSMRSRWLTRRTLLQYGLAVAAAGPWALRQAHGAAAGPEDYRIVWTGQASSSTTRETASLQKPWLALGNSLVISLT